MALLLFAVILSSIAGFAATILGPLLQSPQRKDTPVRFYLCDFFPLTFLLAIPLVYGTTVRVFDQSFGELALMRIVFFMVLFAVFGFVWWRGVVMLARLGIRHPWRRIALLGVLLPLVIVGSIVGIPIARITFVETQLKNEWAILVFAVAFVAAMAASLGGRLLAMWVVKGNNRQEPPTEPEQISWCS